MIDLMKHQSVQYLYQNTAPSPDMFTLKVAADWMSDKNKKQMNTVSSLMKRLLDADTQVLVKAGFLDNSLELTSEGIAALRAIMFETNKAALVAEAQAKLDVEKK